MDTVKPFSFDVISLVYNYMMLFQPEEMAAITRRMLYMNLLFAFIMLS